MPNHPLSEFKKIWDNEVDQLLTNPYVAKMAMPLNTEQSGKGIGQDTYNGLAYTAGYGGRTSFQLEFDPESVNVTSKSWNVPIQFSSRVMTRKDFESFKLKGIPISTDIARMMLDEVLEQQNQTILQGWKPDGNNYAVLGMYNVANNSDACSSFATPGGAIATVSKLIGMLQTDKIFSDDGYNLFLNPAENAKLLASYYSNSGLRERPLVLDLLNEGVTGGGQPGQIISTTAMTAGTCMVAPVASQRNRKFFELIEPQTPYNNLWYVDGNSLDGDIKCRQVASLFPTFKKLDSSNKTDCIAIGTSIA